MVVRMRLLRKLSRRLKSPNPWLYYVAWTRVWQLNRWTGSEVIRGQQQRISIARLFLKNPKILILDEATSSLDNITENLIQQSFEELAKDKTTIMIAHRLSTIQNADEIIVLGKNGIMERGTHEELVQSGGYYQALYNAVVTI